MAAVIAATAVLSFYGLRDLGSSVKIPAFPWLLPIAVDAGAAVSCTVWLARDLPDDAKRFARTMTWLLLAGTVIGNAAQLGMHAAGIVPPWWVAVLVGAIPPAVLGGTWHLAVLAERKADREQSESPTALPQDDLAVPPDVPSETPSSLARVGQSEEPDPFADLSDRRPWVDTSDIRAIVADLGRLRSRHGRTWSRDEIREMYRIGADKAMTARRMCGWPEPVDRTDRARLEPVR
jgi:4-amino-4-deoxy-L-arabinose transferase-like glycosyltransferase